MRIYRVCTFAPLFKDCGTNLSTQRCFSSEAKARKYAVAENDACSEYDEYKVIISKLELKEMSAPNLIEAFSNEDIIDLVSKTTTVVEYVQQLDGLH